MTAELACPLQNLSSQGPYDILQVEVGQQGGRYGLIGAGQGDSLVVKRPRHLVSMDLTAKRPEDEESPLSTVHIKKTSVREGLRGCST